MTRSGQQASPLLHSEIGEDGPGDGVDGFDPVFAVYATVHRVTVNEEFARLVVALI